MLMLVFCSCDFFSPVIKGESDLLSIINKLDEIQNKINSINNNLLIIDSTLIANMSEIEDSLSNITNLLFLTLDGDFSIKGNNSDNSPKDVNVENIFFDTFQIKNIFIKSCLIEEKATKTKMRYFLNDTIVIKENDSIFEYTINKISNFEKYIEIYSLNGEQVFKVAVISD